LYCAQYRAHGPSQYFHPLFPLKNSLKSPVTDDCAPDESRLHPSGIANRGFSSSRFRDRVGTFNPLNSHRRQSEGSGTEAV
jgi:hypothetical protein